MCFVYKSIMKLRPGEENDTYWHPATASLLALSSPVRLLTDLVDFESLGGRAVELVAGVSCTDLSHKRTCVAGVTEEKKKCSRKKEQIWKSGDWGRTQKVKKKLTFSPPGFLQ
jgi:hypothetical protein